ncbi:gliding motility-associated peptidyl-prolyl isomerase GldI [Sinomicrobium soli]|uniref:gliding motility-associated peptidyl-prolyl isomerase GldI n=1 Tax=Sinomicrobium sp. N-1-3-6 TaxID=2219864 RepID=UPI000DCE684A|nr:gliding motility-associated peptidyl-prolyl isomerase GldI [Sinomicrobium sp. N-1-3-6]RAV30122.1 gliding motility-associated peptidyl-prolyl isomerase GldI [Sinomicrobium sp. N-1-3-6]
MKYIDIRHITIVSNIVLGLLISVCCTSCKEPEPRRPVQVKTGAFFRKSVERNQALLSEEQEYIRKLMAEDTVHQYIASSNGYWYYYTQKDSTATYTPKTGDVIVISYDIRLLDNSVVYSREEIGDVTLEVDREHLFPGLRTAVKLLKKGETATFLFPSSLGYGYHGDEERIGINIPIKSTVTLTDILEKAPDSIPAAPAAEHIE